MKKINDDRTIAKKLIFAILNGGLLIKYHDNKDKNKFLKDIENESKINVGGELLLGGAYFDSVFKANSDFSDLYTSIKRRP